jgi:hypothetical protein
MATKAEIRREEGRERFKHILEIAMADKDCRVEHPRPWTCQMIVHNGPRAQFFDALGKPVMTDPLYDPEDAAQLLFNINSGL